MNPPECVCAQCSSVVGNCHRICGLILDRAGTVRASRLVGALEAADSDGVVRRETKGDRRSVGAVVTLYVFVWVSGALAVSIWDPALNLAFNLGMTIFSVIFWVFVALIGKLVRLGVFLGRGNSVGGIGLVLAVIGFALEVTQLV